MRLSLAATLAICATPALSDYSDHAAVRLFSEAPCTEAVATIDKPLPEDGSPEEVARSITRKGMAWGFLLGFDAASGGLHRDGETALHRLRRACAEDPDVPALDLLRSLAPAPTD